MNIGTKVDQAIENSSRLRDVNLEGDHFTQFDVGEQCTLAGASH
jgi:hypothetical protein